MAPSTVIQVAGGLVAVNVVATEQIIYRMAQMHFQRPMKVYERKGAANNRSDHQISLQAAAEEPVLILSTEEHCLSYQFHEAHPGKAAARAKDAEEKHLSCVVKKREPSCEGGELKAVGDEREFFGV